MEQNKNIKQNPFKVPENYFEELPARIQERIDARKSVPERNIRTVLFNSRVLAAASVILILGLASLFIFQFDNQSNGAADQMVLEDYTIISDYLMTDLDEEEIIQAFEDWGDQPDDESIFPVGDLSEQEVIDYLLEDNQIEYYLIEELKSNNYENINLQIKLLFSLDHNYNLDKQLSYSSGA